MFKLIFFFTLVISVSLGTSQKASVSPVTLSVKKRMLQGHSWHKGCPVGLKDLRYLRLPYLGFDGKRHTGEMIVHKDVSDEVVRIFTTLYERGYPIRRMQLVSDFGGNDWRSIEADNTSAFNCRRATGSKKWSRHSYGKAIDLNPIENPYIARLGRIAHRASETYRKRIRKSDTPASNAVLLRGDATVRLFKSYGWRWGGAWHGVKDYQHFDKR